MHDNSDRHSKIRVSLDTRTSVLSARKQVSGHRTDTIEAEAKQSRWSSASLLKPKLSLFFSRKKQPVAPDESVIPASPTALSTSNRLTSTPADNFAKFPLVLALAQAHKISFLCSHPPSKKADGKRLFLLLPGLILQYSAEGDNSRPPERVIKITADSKAFVSDVVVGRKWVLVVGRCNGEDFANNGTSGKARRVGRALGLGYGDGKKGFTGGDYIGNTAKYGKMLVLVFEGHEEMGDWMWLVRREAARLDEQEQLKKSGNSMPKGGKLDALEESDALHDTRFSRHIVISRPHTHAFSQSSSTSFSTGINAVEDSRRLSAYTSLRTSSDTRRASSYSHSSVDERSKYTRDSLEPKMYSQPVSTGYSESPTSNCFSINLQSGADSTRFLAHPNASVLSVPALSSRSSVDLRVNPPIVSDADSSRPKRNSRGLGNPTATSIPGYSRSLSSRMSFPGLNVKRSEEEAPPIPRQNRLSLQQLYTSDVAPTPVITYPPAMLPVQESLSIQKTAHPRPASMFPTPSPWGDEINFSRILTPPKIPPRRASTCTISLSNPASTSRIEGNAAHESGLAIKAVGGDEELSPSIYDQNNVGSLRVSKRARAQKARSLGAVEMKSLGPPPNLPLPALPNGTTPGQCGSC